MKKCFAVLISLLSFSAFAKERVNTALVNLIQEKQIVPNIRVYTSKKIAVTYKNNLLQETEVENGNLNKVVNQNILTKIVQTSTRGKIVEFTVERKYNRYSGYYDGPLNGIYVSFDSNCHVKECSYLFSKTRDGEFVLTSTPAVKGHEFIKLKLGRLFGARNAYLEYNKNELMNITKIKEVADGHE